MVRKIPMIKIIKKKDRNRADRPSNQSGDFRPSIRNASPRSPMNYLVNKSRSSGEEEEKEDSFSKMRRLICEKRDKMMVN